MAFKLREFFTAAAQGHTSLVDPVHGLQMKVMKLISRTP
jgi:hypothetical protein